MYTLQTTTLFLFGFFLNSRKVAGMIYMGCYQDSKENRVLADYDYHSNSNSPTECSNNCRNYKFFGVEAWSHCLCGNTINSATQVPESECTRICPGETSKRCGDHWRINLYRHWGCPLGSYSVKCSKQCHCRVSSCDDVTGACGNGGCKDGWKGIACNESMIYMGCYQDSGGNQVLADYDYHSNSNSPTECSNNCRNYKFFGVEAWSHCLCGNTINSATQVPESECTRLCPGETSKRCGDHWRINLYRHWGCPLGSYGVNCSKQCHCRKSSCDDVTGACGNGGCKDGWKGIACDENEWQWVSGVLNFSSQYNTGTYSAQQILGVPDVYPSYGDLHGAWASKDIDANQFLEFQFATPVYVTKVDVYETYNAGGVKAVKCLDVSGTWITLWSTPQVSRIQSARIFSPSFTSTTPCFSNQIRLDIDCTLANTWVEIDAVRLHGPKDRDAVRMHGSQEDYTKTIIWTLIAIVLTILIGSGIALRQVRRRRALNAVQLNQLQSSNSPQGTTALNTVQLNQLQSSNSTQGSRALNTVQLNQLQSSNSSQVRRAPNAVQLNQLQSSNNPQERAPNAVQLNQLQSSNTSQGRRALNAVQLNQLQSSNNPQAEWRRALNAVQLKQLQSSNSQKVNEVRKYDMQVKTHNAEAKEEKNNVKVVNSSDFVI
ncbi:uncharacterized protein LOC127846389 isoform X3 [Dreissena polymorpha]|uniref:uncharacterized protein LOC127846389 isoform X3 n=1 Tax=Dreissena polymorpha TaxID=45954 RepID=UPI0022651146|nr:uncharacterized protein LOC127846389 isoform X3 [Dreissena polymorpha]